MRVEGRPKGRLEPIIEESMPASVTIKQVKNLFTESPRFPGEG
jgi:hypothetical protein